MALKIYREYYSIYKYIRLIPLEFSIKKRRIADEKS